MSIFSKPQMPPPPPPPPTVADYNVTAAKTAQSKAAAGAVGQQDQIKTSGQGVLAPARTTKKSVLG